MPLAALAPALIAGGGAIAGAAISSSAAKKAANTAAQASEQNAAIQKAIYDQQRADLQPYAQSGRVAQSALLSRLGLAGPQPTYAPSPSVSPAAAQTGAPGYRDQATPMPTGTMATAPKTGLSTIPANPSAGLGNLAANPTYNTAGFTPGPNAAAAASTDSFPTPSGGQGAPMAGVAGGAASAPAANGPLTSADYAAIRQAWPGIEQNFNDANLPGHADKNSPVYQQKGLNNLDSYTQYWYDNIRNPADYSYTPPGQAASTPAAAGATTPQAPVPGQTFDSANNAGLGPRQTFTRDAMARPTFNEAQPTFGAAPTTGQYLDPGQFQTSPGYQFRLQQGLRAANANYGARGLLKSDAAIKGLNDYAQGQASSEYGNWFNQQLQRYGADVGQYNIDRTTGLAQYNQNRNVFNNNYQFDANRYDNNFNTDANRYDVNFNNDRGYNTDWYNQYTANLFQLAGMGQNAAAGQGAAGQNYANAMTANNNSLASVQGNAAIAGANGAVGAINGASQAIGYALNPFSVSGSGYASPRGNIPSEMTGLY